jgi:hypothetical protein
MGSVGMTTTKAAPRLRRVYVVVGAALVAAAILAVVLWPKPNEYKPGSHHAAVLINEMPSQDCVGPDGWKVRVGGRIWTAEQFPPADWGSGPVSGEIEIVGAREGLGDNWALFEHGDASIYLQGVKGVAVGCRAIG